MSVKLTLTVDPRSVARGKAYAARHRTSLSRMVEALFLALPDETAVPRGTATDTLTARLVGIGRAPGTQGAGDDRALLAKALEEKFL